jgi:hypothetical protein
MLHGTGEFAAISTPASAPIPRQRKTKLPGDLAVTEADVVLARLDQVPVALIEPQQRRWRTPAATEDELARRYFADVDGHGDVPSNLPCGTNLLNTLVATVWISASDKSRQHWSQNADTPADVAAGGTARRNAPACTASSRNEALHAQQTGLRVRMLRYQNDIAPSRSG